MFNKINECLKNWWELIKQYAVDFSFVDKPTQIKKDDLFSTTTTDKKDDLFSTTIIDKISYEELFYIDELLSEIPEHVKLMLCQNKNTEEIDFFFEWENYFYRSVNDFFDKLDVVKNGVSSFLFSNNQIVLINIDVYNYLIICNLILYVIYLNNFQNKYTVYKIFFVIILSMYLFLYKSTNTYLVLFIILTELFSVYLILLITAKINKIVFKYNNNYIFLYICTLIYTVNNIYMYTYFDYYSANVTIHTNYSYFLIIFKTYYIYTLLSLLILLTLLILNFFLYKLYNEKKLNIYMLWSNLYLLMNKTANNLNLYINNFIFKWK